MRRKFTLSTSAEYVSARQTVDSNLVRPILLWDATASTDKLWRHFEASAGVRNLLNWAYSDPTQIAVDSLLQDGRSVFVRLVWRPVE
jgi:outer membrane receptor protein involved in Fe transport